MDFNSSDSWGTFVRTSEMSNTPLFDVIDIPLSGMSAMRDQMDLIASNIANVNTTHTIAGGPYRRRVALMQEKVDFDQYFVPAAFGQDPFDQTSSVGSGVAVGGVVEDPSPPKLVYDPSNPEADERGYVLMPNVDLITEMTNMLQTSRAYEANAMVVETNKTLMQKTLDIAHYR